MQKYVITEAEAREIKAIIKKYRKTTAYTKLQAVMLMGEGKNVHTVAEITGYHYQWIYVLVKQYCTQTFEEFVGDNRGGSHRKNLSNEVEEELINKFKDKAEKGEIVSLSEIRQAYDEKLGRESANSTFYGFMHRMGWRKVKPRGRHPKKANEEDIEASKKLKVV